MSTLTIRSPHSSLVPQAVRSRPGFTLIETLVALTVVLFGFLAALVMQQSSYRSGSIAEQQTLAVFLAESKIEEFRNYIPDSFPSEKLDYFDRTGSPTNEAGRYYTRSVTLVRQSPTQFTNEIEVKVAWPKANPVVYRSIVPIKS
ncbi:MAG: prepilin-type N-terminal cleavage/methylation domain-containing protein [Deltaproteobacteria bacterium]|jgi:prepilin-type N-terminal cleavage/methylation domain-containing protein|nr:prepilin-type N-terminal cleavage/methylation domain-containing protein [Deltaproteobacteria bacterium]